MLLRSPLIVEIDCVYQILLLAEKAGKKTRTAMNSLRVDLFPSAILDGILISLYYVVS